MAARQPRKPSPHAISFDTFFRRLAGRPFSQSAVLWSAVTETRERNTNIFDLHRAVRAMVRVHGLDFWFGHVGVKRVAGCLYGL